MGSFFLAWMTLDQRRIESRRNACCPCFSHSDWRPNRLSQKSLLKTTFSAYSKFLTRTPVKVNSNLLTAFFSNNRLLRGLSYRMSEQKGGRG